jgi:uncharacterized membrane protein
MKRSHLIVFAASFGIILASIIASMIFWSDLPARIPTHFGVSGAPDAWSVKNIWYVFMLPFMNLLMAGLFTVIYRFPQYTSWPTTLVLMTVDEEKREKIFEVLRSMNAWIFFLITSMFAYLQYAILATANGRAFGVLNYIMIGFLVVMFAYIIMINVRMFFAVKGILKEHKRKSR